MAAKYSVIPDQTGGIITEQLLRNLTDSDPLIEDTVYRDLLVAKVVSILVLGLVSFIIGLLPVQLVKWFHWKFDTEHNTKTSGNLVISLLLCFGGGVLMFTTFIHLQPEVREDFEVLRKRGLAPDFDQFADLVYCLGFFFVYLIEEIVHGFLDRKHNHTENDSFFHRSVSLRGCSQTKPSNVESGQGIIPRVNLSQKGDEKAAELGSKSKSTSTQGLLDSSSVIHMHQSKSVTAFEQNYPTRFSQFDPESQISNGQFGRYSPKEDSPMRREEKHFEHPVEKPSPPGSHTHSHSSFNDDLTGQPTDLANTLRGFFTVLALSFHAVFEGLAVGLENDVPNVWYLFLAIATHKFVIAFCVGVDLVSTKTKIRLILLYLGTFAFVTPLGIGIGIGLSDDPSKAGTELVTVILQGMAAGTLLYVVFFEVLQREKANSQSGILQLIAIMAGFGVMFALQFVTGHHHHHAEGLDSSHLLIPALHSGDGNHDTDHHHFGHDHHHHHHH